LTAWNSGSRRNRTWISLRFIQATGLRVAHRWHWLTDGQYEHVSRLVAEIGRLLGGWIKHPEGGQKAGAAGTGPGGARS